MHGLRALKTPPPVQQTCAESYSTQGAGLHYILETQSEGQRSAALQELAEGPTAAQRELRGEGLTRRWAGDGQGWHPPERDLEE